LVRVAAGVAAVSGLRGANGKLLKQPVSKLTAFAGQEFEGGPATMLVIKGFSSEEAVAEFCLKLAALGILSVAPARDDTAKAGSLQ
jgi:hypothetical protein